MASLAVTVLLALVAANVVIAASPAAAAPDAGGRPTHEEWKEGKEAEANAANVASAKQSKMAAVDKVVVMLEDLQTQVMDEGEKEAKTYDKFACFCKDMTADKTEAIEKGGAEKTRLSAEITDKQAKRDELDSKIEEISKEISEAEQEMKVAKEERAKERNVYAKNEADLSGALEALEGAIGVLKASKNPSLVQVQRVMKTVRMAAMMADALGLSSVASQRALALLQQDPEVPTQDYNFHSDSVIETLEKLLKDFQQQKAEVDAPEVKSIALHDAFMQEKTDFVKRKTMELEDTKKEKATVQSEIATTSKDLSTVAAVLLDDQEYIKGLSKICTNKAKTWDQRSGVRQDELSALTAAITILKGVVSEKVSGKTVRFAQQGVSVELAESVARSEDAMESVEEDAEEADAPVSFLQRGSGAPGKLMSALASKSRSKAAQPDGARQAVVAILRGKGKDLQSKLLSALASQIDKDPFAKVKQLIQELIERLLKESSNEATQKGWCDKSLSDASQKRDHAAASIEELNSGMAPLEALRRKLVTELEKLDDEIAGLAAQREEATEMRDEEKAENETTVKEAKAGIAAVEQASDIISKFYRTSAKAKVDLAALQRGVDDDAPDAGFEAGEAYKGAQGTAGGVLGMLDVIKSDFQRTVSETEQADALSAQDFLEFMTDSGKSLAEKKVAKEQRTSQKDDAEEQLQSAGEDLDSQTALLQKSIEELLELKPACIDTGMTYAERVAHREEEVEALKKALCVLQAYEQYGPDGAGGMC